jgi:hypothetical protein
MITASSLSPAAASSFKAFTSLDRTSLTDSVNVLFGLTVVCVVGCAFYSASKLYTAYQCYYHTSFGLPDELKLVKCRALLVAVDRKKAAGENVELRLQECESLFNSISKGFSSTDKEKFLVKLAQHYVEKDPEHAYSISQSLTSSNQLFDAAQTIQKKCPAFDQKKLTMLYERAVIAREIEKKQEAKSETRENSFEDVSWELKLAQSFHAVGKSQDKDICMSQAMIIANSFKEPLTKIRALCKIAVCSRQIEAYSSEKQSVVDAQALMSEIPAHHLVQAHLYLAHTYLALDDTVKMEQKLRHVYVFYHENPTEIHKDLYLFAQCISKFSKDPKYDTGFSNEHTIQPLILMALEKLKLPAKDEANTYLNIARIYQENLVEDAVSEETLKKLAQGMIVNLPIDSAEDRNSKIELLVRLGSYSKQQPKSAMIDILNHLEVLYASCPFESTHDDIWNKMDLGITIVKFYNEMKMEAQSTAFFQKWVSDLINQKDKSASSKIYLLAYILKHYHADFSPDQRNSLAQEADEKLFKQLSPNERKTCFVKVVNDYLDVDIDISLPFLSGWETYQARSSVITAAVTAVSIGAIYFYPATTPLLLVGAFVLRLR